MSYYNFYFSPTGGTKKVADVIVSKLKGDYKAVDLCEDINLIKLNSDDICMFSVPSYGGRVPDLAITRINKIIGNGAKAILNCVYGNREWEDTLTELQDTLEGLGFRCISAIAAVAEHSIFRQYAKGRPNEEDKIELCNFALTIQNIIDKGIYNNLNLDGNHFDYKLYNKPSLIPFGNDKCIQCGLCSSKCPALAIDINNPKFTDKEKCISCMRCVYLCPQHARDFDAEMMEQKARLMEARLGGYKKNYLFI